MKKFQSLYDAEPLKEGVDLKTLAAIADAHARQVWGGDVTHGDPFPVYDSNESINAYVFPFALGQGVFPGAPALAGRQSDGGVRFGAVYVAARRTEHPVLRVIHSLHPLYVHGEDAIKVGRSMLAGDVRINRIYWLGFHQEYFEITAGEHSILMDAVSLKQAPSETIKQRDALSSEGDDSVPYWKNAIPKDILPQEAVYDEKRFENIVNKIVSTTQPAIDASEDSPATTFKLVPLADCVPVVNWTWWCVPTAFTMATCYYDNYIKDIGGLTGYGRLVSYWFDHPKSGSNVPDFIDLIVDPKTGTWRTGSNGFGDFIHKTFGYTGFTTRDVTANAANDWAWNEIKAEIDAGRPFVWSIPVPKHDTCAFGYRITPSGKYVIIHTTWGNTSAEQREEWLYTKGDGLTAITPGGGAVGQNLVIWQPDGGETLSTNVSTTIRWHIWGSQIKTAEIMVSDDGGNNWTTIAIAVPCVTGWNEYSWTPQVPTERARVRIRGLDANGAYIAGDGSQTNLRVLPGPRPVTLKTILVKTMTDKNGLFSAPHGLERYSSDGHAIRAISVAAQHKNGNWHTLEYSNSVDNRFWWNKEVVAGVMGSPNFAEQPVQILVFAELVVG